MAANKTESKEPLEKPTPAANKKKTKVDVETFAHDHNLVVEYGHKTDMQPGSKALNWWCFKHPQLRLMQFIGNTHTEAYRYLEVFVAGVLRAKKGNWRKHI